MNWLGEVVAGEVVPYGASYHDDTGNAADPATPTLHHMDASGNWEALAAPAKQNDMTGQFGGSIDTAAYGSGIHLFVQSGVVATAKTVRNTFVFRVVSKRAEGAAAPEDVSVTVPEPVFGGVVTIDPPVALTTEEHDHLMSVAVPLDESLVTVVTHASNDASGNPIGAFPEPNVNIEAWVVNEDSTTAYRRSCVTDGDGGFSIKLEKGATYHLHPRLSDNRTVTAKEVSV